MIEFYRIEHPDGRSLYVDNDDFLEKAGMMDHHYSDFHKGIFDMVRQHYYINIVDLTNSLNATDSAVDIITNYYDAIDDYMHKFTFRCAFNNLDIMRKWFNADNVYHMQKEGFVLYKYSLVVDFDPMKIFICDMQTAIDIEYLQRESTIKTLVDWDVLYKQSLAKRFVDKINGMTFEELDARAQKAESCGMGIIINEWVDFYGTNNWK